MNLKSELAALTNTGTTQKIDDHWVILVARMKGAARDGRKSVTMDANVIPYDLRDEIKARVKAEGLKYDYFSSSDPRDPSDTIMISGWA